MKIGIPYGTTPLSVLYTYPFLLLVERATPHAIQKCLNGRNAAFFILASCLHCWRSQRTFFPSTNRTVCERVFPHDAHNVSFFSCSLWQTGSLFIKSVFLCWQFSDSNTTAREQKKKYSSVRECIFLYTHKYPYRENFFGFDSIQIICVSMLYVWNKYQICTLDIRIHKHNKRKKSNQKPLMGQKKMIVLILDTRIKNHLR